MLTIKSFIFNPFQVNTYVLYDETDECVVIDAACYDLWEKEELSDFIADKGLKTRCLLNTHCHVDHILGNKYITDTFDFTVCASPADGFLLEKAENYGLVFGFEVEAPPAVQKELNEGNIIKFGNSELEVIHIGGHSPGCICFLNKEQKILFAGDVLFDGSIGRTDLPGGDYQKLIQNIKQKLLTLGDEYVVYSGHGSTTTIGKERKTNPFLK